MRMKRIMKMKIIKKKKGFTLAVNYIFLFFIGVIVAMLVVGMITKGYINVERFMCRLTGTCDNEKDGMIGVQKINATCDNAEREILKHTKLCYEHGINGEVKGLCYVIFLPENCGPKSDELKEKLWNEYDINASVIYDGEIKAVIAYDYEKQRVEVR